MKERPILFSAPMAHAILDKRKTQTRRLVKPQPRIDAGSYAGCAPAREMYGPAVHGKFGAYFGPQFIPCPYGKPGDRLWVKETWKPDPSWGQSSIPTMKIQEGSNILYRSTLPEGHAKYEFGKWRPSIFMRRWMSRFTLEVVAVRAERLQSITEADAIAEGIYFDHDFDGYVSDNEGRHYHGNSSTRSYEHLWHSINGPASWSENPWVWVIEFRPITKN